MKILIVSAYCINTPHFETELEIIQTHLDQGDQVTMLSCDATLLSCDVNPSHNSAICLRCMGRRKSGVKALGKEIDLRPIVNLSEDERTRVSSLVDKFYHSRNLATLEVDDFDLGYGVLSSLISAYREPNPDLQDDQLAETAARIVEAAASTYFSVKRYIAAGAFGCVYVYNGRYAIMRAVLRASQSEGVDCFCHEKGGSLDKYALYKNGLPHDRDIFSAKLNQAWESADEAERIKVSNDFYQERRASIDQSWFSFVKDQEQGKLPDGWDESKRNIIIFNSSEDEFASIGRQWEDSLYSDQQQGIESIVKAFADNPKIHFYLRIHPNLKGLDNTQTRELMSLDRPNLSVIPAESPVSSYALIDSAEKILVFGSTVGIEATWSGVPAILLGRAFYEAMDAVYEPGSPAEVIELIRSQLQPMEKLAALKYGYYVKTFGRKFTYYEASGVYMGEFNGAPVEVDSWYEKKARLAERSEYLRHRVRSIVLGRVGRIGERIKRGK